MINLVQVERSFEGEVFVVATNEKVSPITTFKAEIFRWDADLPKSEKEKDLKRTLGGNAYEIGGGMTLDGNPSGKAIRDYAVTYHIIPEDAHKRALDSPEREERELRAGYF